MLEALVSTEELNLDLKNPWLDPCLQASMVFDSQVSLEVIVEM